MLTNNPDEKSDSTNTINFFSKLKDKRSYLIFNEVYKFINTTFAELVDQMKDIAEISTALQDFVNKITNDFARTWSLEFTHNKYAYIEICDGFEGLIMKSVYTQVFTMIKESLREDRIERLIKKYSFISLKHLGIEFPIDEFELVVNIKSINVK